MYATVHKEPSAPDDPPRKDCYTVRNDGYRAANEVSNSVQDPVYQDIPGNAGLSKENINSLGKQASICMRSHCL